MEFLTPMILQYLTDDAQNAGLTTEWRLAGYVGFIVNLALACVVGFQAPVVTLLTLRFGIATRQQITQYRKHIWFTAFVWEHSYLHLTRCRYFWLLCL